VDAAGVAAILTASFTFILGLLAWYSGRRKDHAASTTAAAPDAIVLRYERLIKALEAEINRLQRRLAHYEAIEDDNNGGTGGGDDGDTDDDPPRSSRRARRRSET
jgi:hypothetical protein